jgi:hypothetical protein
MLAVINEKTPIGRLEVRYDTETIKVEEMKRLTSEQRCPQPTT